MVKIVIENFGKKELMVNDLSQPVLQLRRSHFVDWMQACGGKGRCTTCRIVVQPGMDMTSPPSAAELCQAFISGDMVVRNTSCPILTTMNDPDPGGGSNPVWSMDNPRWTLNLQYVY
jgi:ferredoxin